jgi:hypothetical protein
VFSQRREIHFVIITDTSANKHKPVCLSSGDGNVSEIELYKHFEHIIAVKSRGCNGRGMWHAWGEE